VFLVNRSQTESIDVVVDLSDVGAGRIVEAVTLHDDDPYAKNTLADQTRVGLSPLAGAELADGILTVTLPPVSWSAVACA
jgi:alpha-N-arabinofuranosidase